jgi:outer membrane protein assembly factor BamB
LTAPAADLDGNCYFIGHNFYLYALSPSGEVRWTKKDYDHPLSVDQLTITEEGILAKSLAESGSLQLISFDGDIIWEKDTRYADYYLAPNGTLFCFTIDDRVLGIDAKGKTMWSTKDIPQNKSLEGAFFDT